MHDPPKDSTKLRDFLLLAILAIVCIAGSVAVITKLVEQEETHVNTVKKTHVSGHFGAKKKERDNETDLSVKDLCENHPDETVLTFEAFSISNNALRYVGTMKKLVELSVAFTRVDDNGLKYISKLPLKSLNLSETQVTDAGLKYIGKIKTLNHLNATSCNITDAGLTELRPLEQLRDLNIGSTKITDAGVTELAEHHDLKRLNLDNTQITDDCFNDLGKLMNLDRLELDSTSVTIAGLTKLTNHNLEKLTLQGCKINDDDLPALVSAQPQLDILVLSNTPITDRGLATLTKLKKLRTLEVRGCNKLTPKAKEAFSAKLPLCRVTDQLLSKEVQQ